MDFEGLAAESEFGATAFLPTRLVDRFAELWLSAERVRQLAESLPSSPSHNRNAGRSGSALSGRESVRIFYVELVRETLRRIVSLFRCKEFIRHWVSPQKLRVIVIEDIRKVEGAITSLGQINDFSGHC